MGNKKGQTYQTLPKELEQLGFPKAKDMTPNDWVRFAELKNGGKKIGIPTEGKSINPNETLADSIAKIVEIDKARDELIPNWQPRNPDDETEQEPLTGAPKEKEPAPEDPLKSWDGAMLLWMIEAGGVQIAKPICKKLNRQVPPPEKFEFSEMNKRFMKPGADIYMEKIKNLIRHKPEYAFLAGVVMQWGFVIMNSPKIEPIEINNDL